MGPEGIGKETLARTIGAALNCEEAGCGSCQSCLRTERGVHPDVVVVEPEGNLIPISEIRELSRRAYLRPFEGQRKVLIIKEAQAMRPEAANALLKILEEPPADVVFVLIAEREEQLLPTIVSRCQRIKFRPVTAEKLTEFLTSRYEVSEEEARLFSRASAGNPGHAVTLAESEPARARRAIAIDAMKELPGAEILDLLARARELSKEAKKPLVALKKIHSRELKEELDRFGKSGSAAVKKGVELRQKREKRRAELDSYGDIFRAFSSWYRDLIVLSETGEDELLFNQDYREELEARGTVSSKAMLEGLAEIRRVSDSFRFNVNRELALEVLLFNLQEVK